MSTRRTIGEQRFEEYLKAMEYPFEYEKEYAGKRKKPDYTVVASEASLFDVKDFDPHMFLGCGQFDPYGEIRQRIEYGRAKFKEYKEFSCSVVLQNNGNVFADTEHPRTVFGAMYGDMGFSIPVYIGPGTAPEQRPPIRECFLGGAMMLPNKNTTINALVTLRYIPVGRLRIRRIWDRYPSLGASDVLQRAFEQFGEDFDACEVQQGVIVWENVYARIPLSRELFLGQFDERWGLDGADLTRIFCGPKLLELEG